jgi:hypothetical protein
VAISTARRARMIATSRAGSVARPHGVSGCGPVGSLA